MTLLGYKPISILLLAHKALERLTYYGFGQGLRKYFSAREYPEDEISTYYNLFSALFWLIAIVGGYLSDERFGKWKTGFGGGIIFVLGTVLFLIAMKIQVHVLIWIAASFWALGGGIMLPCITSYAGDQVRDHAKGTERFFGLWFVCLQICGVIYVIIGVLFHEKEGKPMSNAMKLEKVTTLFWILSCTAITSLLLLIPFSWSAKHSPPGPTQMIQAMRAIICGSDDLDLQERAKSVKKAYSVFICIFFWGVTANLVGTYFQTQAEMMKRPFDWWNSHFNQCFDGPPQVVFVPLIAWVKRTMESKGYTASHQKIIFSGMIAMIALMGYSALLQLFIIRDKGNINMFVQLPLWFLSAYGETAIYSYGLDFSYSVAHPSMKSLILSFFYGSLGFGMMTGSLIFTAFANHMPFANGYNSCYQSIVFLGVCILNTVVFFFFSDWTPVQQKKETDVEAVEAKDTTG